MVPFAQLIPFATSNFSTKLAVTRSWSLLRGQVPNVQDEEVHALDAVL